MPELAARNRAGGVVRTAPPWLPPDEGRAMCVSPRHKRRNRRCAARERRSPADRVGSVILASQTLAHAPAARQTSAPCAELVGAELVRAELVRAELLRAGRLR